MNIKKISAGIALLAIIGSLSLSVSYAASLTSVSDTLSRLKTSSLADHTIKFVTPTGVTAGQNITITFPGSFTMGTFNVNNVDVATATSCGGSFTDKTLAASASGATWGVSQSGQVITIASGTDTISSTNCIAVEIGANAISGATGATQITNPGSAATYAVAIAGSFGDTGSASVQIISDDQVAVTATVDQTLSFALSSNSIGFGSLSSGATRYANTSGGAGSEPSDAHTITAGTNATSGYTATITGATLTSGANTISAISGGPTALSAGSEQFGIRASASGGTGALSSPFDGSSGNYGFSSTPTTPVTFASASGSSATTTYSVNYAANIASTTEAGAYSTALTYVASANF